MMGWWKIEYWKDNGEELTDGDKEHIAEEIKKGYNQGEIVDE